MNEFFFKKFLTQKNNQKENIIHKFIHNIVKFNLQNIDLSEYKKIYNQVD